jgi:hypothetical protein
MNDYQIEESYKEMLDDAYGTVTIAGYEYQTSYALKECDPIAYRVGLSDFEATLEAELCEICESNEKENPEGKWCTSCKDDNKESEND